MYLKCPYIYGIHMHVYSNKKETSDFHGTVSFDPVKIWTDKQTLLTSNLQGQLAGRIKNKCSLYHSPLVRKSTFQQIRLNSAQHVWISIKEEWADTFDPIIGRL